MNRFFCILFWTPISAFHSRVFARRPSSKKELRSSQGAGVWCSITFGYPYKQKTLSELDTLKGLKYYYQRNQAAKSQSPATKCYPLNSPIAINLSCRSATSFSTGILDNVLMSFRSTFFTLSKVDSGS